MNATGRIVADPVATTSHHLTDDQPTPHVSVAADPTDAARSPGPGRLRTVLVSAAIFAAVVALVVWQRDRLADLPAVLGDANWWWIGVAIMFQAMSMASTARLQRRLLDVDGHYHAYRSVLATTYAGNAISAALPLVGSVASTIFSFRRFVLTGVGKVLAGWSLAIAGVFGTIGLFAVSSVGAIVSGSTGVAVAGLVTAIVGVVPITVALAGLQRPAVRQVVVALIAVTVRLRRRVTGHPGSDATTLAVSTVDNLRQFRLTLPDLLVGIGFALSNRLFDAACLASALQAIGAPIPWQGLLLAWAAGAGASTLGLTPGGLGVVEAALSVSLVATGLSPTLAVSGVLLYRFVKLWLVLGVGAITLLVIRTRSSRKPAPVS